MKGKPWFLIQLIVLVVMISGVFYSCGPGIEAEYETVKTKKIILLDEDGKEYSISIQKNANGEPSLQLKQEN